MTDLSRAAWRAKRMTDPRAVQPGKLSAVCRRKECGNACTVISCACECHRRWAKKIREGKVRA